MTNYLTKEGLAQLLAEQKDLQEVKLPKALETLNKARSEGDLSENAAYDAAKDDRQKIEYKIAEIEDILSDYEIIKDKSKRNNQIVEIGDTVEVEFLDTEDKKNFSLTIVGESEANAIKSKISNESPLAKSILGKSVKDEVEFKIKGLTHKVKIIKINS